MAAPPVNYMGYAAMNRGECLLKSLNILMRIHKREQEKQRLALGSGVGGKQKGTGNRRPDKPEPASFEFASVCQLIRNHSPPQSSRLKHNHNIA